MTEIAFQVDQDPAGNFTVRAIGLPIEVAAGDVAQIETNIRAALAEHFPDPAERPQVVHLYFLCQGAIASTCTLPL